MKHNNGLILKSILLLICTVAMISLFMKRPSEDSIKETVVGLELSEEPIKVTEITPPENEIPEEEIQLRENIFVLIMSSNYESIFHEDIQVTNAEGLTAQGEVYTKLRISDLKLDEDESVRIRSTNSEDGICINGIKRAQTKPKYSGSLIITKKPEGYIIVNELNLEDYLKTVLPSEMPSDYPMEALKAQAICARTYAVNKMLNPAYPQYGADLNDSSDFQVYNNIAETENTNQAIEDTKGYVVKSNGELIDAFYYSTSCGFGTVSKIWKEEIPRERPYLSSGQIAIQKDAQYTPEELQEESTFKDFITQTNPSDLDVTEAWYRWSYTVNRPSVEVLKERLSKLYEERPHLVLTWNEDTETFEQKPIQQLGKLKDIIVTKRLPGGVIDELELVTTTDTILVITEYNIRYCLSSGEAEAVRQDKSKVTMQSLLPSAFFTISCEKDKNGCIKAYTLTGGGFGHGVGMSQNAAKNAAEQGLSWQDILFIFYSEISVDVLI